jgi:hypothetical protein
MNRNTTSRLAHAFAALALASLSVTATAQTNALRQLCPEAEAQLQDALGAIAQKMGVASTVQAQFKLDQGVATAIRVEHGPSAYRRAVERAVRGLYCPQARGAAPSQHALNVEMRAPGANVLPLPAPSQMAAASAPASAAKP